MDMNSPLTLQFQLRSTLYANIENKIWLPGQKIPSERELCEEHNVSRMTVREVLKDLEQSGYLVRKQGKGTFVATPAIEYKMTSTFSLSQVLQQNGASSEFEILGYEICKVPDFLRETFKLADSDEVVELIRVRRINGEAYAWEKAVVPCKYLAGATQQDIDKNGLYPMMKASSGIFPEYSEESVDAVSCPKKVAENMGLAQRTAVFFVTRFTMAGDTCVEYCESYVYGQRYHCQHIIRQK